MRDSLRMRWLVVRAIFGSLVLILFLAGCDRGEMPPSAPLTSTMDVTALSAIEAGHLSVLGTILPAQRVKLGFRVGGAVEVVNVQIGMEVKAGDLLAELDATDLKLDVREAEEALARSQSALEQASTGPREQEVAVAEAQYQRALAQHEGLLAGARPEEIAAARADWEAALARYEQVKAGANVQELSAAEASLEKAEIALKRAQAAYDLVAWRPDLEASPQAAALQEATVDYQVAKAQLERVQGLPTEADLQEARAQLARAEAQLKLAQAGPSPQEVVASASSVAVAQAQLKLAKAGPRLEGVAVAMGQVQQARTALERAELALSRAKLPAPFDGTVSAVYLSPGEWAGPGVQVVELLDTSRWRVETRNVGELNIGRVRTGQEAVVRVIAFGDRELRGRVAAISPIAVVQQGDTTYTVFIDLEPTDLNLRPGMNVEVEILTE
jgi:HlyD family secretion protein